MKWIFRIFLLCISSIQFSYGQDIKKLTDEELTSFRQQARVYISDLSRYIEIIANKSTPIQQRSIAINLAVDLFISENNIVEVPYKNITKSYRIRPYLNRISNLPYIKVGISYYNIYLADEFKRGVDGKYYGIATVFQRFNATNNSEMPYTDITKKSIQVVVEKIKYYEGLNEKDRWVLKLGDIQDEETSIDKAADTPSIKPSNDTANIAAHDTLLSYLHINAPVSYSETDFRKKAEFIAGTFQKNVSFSSLSFDDSVSIYKSIFNSYVSFENVIFKNLSKFDESVFNGNCTFSNCSFGVKSTFNGVLFQKDAAFVNDTFRRLVTFQNMSAYRQVDFSGSCFYGVADFSSVKLVDSTKFIFYQILLPALIDFSNNQRIYHEIDLLKCNFDANNQTPYSAQKLCYINMYNADIPKIKIDYQHFRLFFNDNLLTDKAIRVEHNYVYINGKAYRIDENTSMELLKNEKFRDYIFHIFPSFKYYQNKSFYLSVVNSASIVFNPKEKLIDSIATEYINYCLENKRFPKRLFNEEIASVYEKALKNFDVQGQKESYETLDIEYKDFKNNAFILPHIWNCYGYHKEWIFYWAIFFLSFFTFVTFCFIGYLRDNVYEVSFFDVRDVRLRKEKESIQTKATFAVTSSRVYGQKKMLGRFANRLWYSFVYTSVIFFLFSLKIENFKFKLSVLQILGTVYVVIVYSTGIACLAYMANFVLQK